MTKINKVPLLTRDLIRMIPAICSTGTLIPVILAAIGQLLPSDSPKWFKMLLDYSAISVGSIAILYLIFVFIYGLVTRRHTIKQTDRHIRINRKYMEELIEKQREIDALKAQLAGAVSKEEYDKLRIQIHKTEVKEEQSLQKEEQEEYIVRLDRIRQLQQIIAKTEHLLRDRKINESYRQTLINSLKRYKEMLK